MPSTGTIKVSSKEREARILRAVRALRGGVLQRDLEGRYTREEIAEAARRAKK